MFYFGRLIKACSIFVLLVALACWGIFSISLDASEVSLADINIVETSSNINIDNNGCIDLNIQDFTSLNQEQNFYFVIENTSNQAMHITFQYDGPDDYIAFNGKESIVLQPQETYQYEFSLLVIQLPNTVMDTHINVSMTVVPLDE